MPARILLADDDPAMVRLVAHRLRQDGHEVTTSSDGTAAFARLRAEPHDLVISDLEMPGLDGLGLLDAVRAFDPHLPVLLLTAHSSVPSAVQAMRRGAWDYLEKPVDHERLRTVVARAIEHRALARRFRTNETPRPTFHGMVGQSRPVQHLFQTIERVAKYEAPVLVIGESGTGKELIARAIYEESPRAGRPFVAINSAGIVDSLFESLFFGHEKGSFTGAQSHQKGWMSAASGGVLFLDEVGEMPLGQQAKLLRALETQEILPVGASRPVKVDVRVVAATNKDLREAIVRREFREDLYYRLRGVELRVPPLAERMDDVPLLAEWFLDRANAQYGRRLSFDAGALRALSEWDWPGNVRELRQVVTSAAMLADGDVIRASDILLDQRPSLHRPTAPPRSAELPEAPAAAPAAPAAPTSTGHATTPAPPPPAPPLALDALEREHLDRVLTLARDNRSKAAQMLGVSRHALYRMMRRHGKIAS